MGFGSRLGFRLASIFERPKVPAYRAIVRTRVVRSRYELSSSSTAGRVGISDNNDAVLEFGYCTATQSTDYFPIEQVGLFSVW
jgi:hypothetical protein